MISFIKNRILPSRFVQLFIRTGQKWAEDQCLEMGAAISYYALFSLFPIVLVMLSIAGFFLGPNTDIMSQVLGYAQVSLPPSAYSIVEDVAVHLNESSIGAGVVGFLILFFAASNVFGALDRSIDKIWKVPADEHSEETVKSRIFTFIQDRIVAFSLVISTAALMVLSLFANIAVKTLRELLVSFNELITFINLDEVLIIKNVQVISTFVILCLVILILYKILPSTRVAWRDIWLGSLLCASLLVLLQMLVSNSIIRIGSQFRSYGVIGGVMVLLLWLYWTCQIFFIGSEFSYVYAHLFGTRRSPRD
ncbi:MAG: YihY/virulence factor BrkB family protein, partial [Leptolyngbyaceae bacterium]|nr:YihY/virulence factor BrkB family protein [Leptolyngbyaceae bacterium]